PVRVVKAAVAADRHRVVARQHDVPGGAKLRARDGRTRRVAEAAIRIEGEPVKRRALALFNPAVRFDREDAGAGVDEVNRAALRDRDGGAGMGGGGGGDEEECGEFELHIGETKTRGELLTERTSVRGHPSVRTVFETYKTLKTQRNMHGTAVAHSGYYDPKRFFDGPACRDAGAAHA